MKTNLRDTVVRQLRIRCDIHLVEVTLRVCWLSALVLAVIPNHASWDQRLPGKPDVIVPELRTDPLDQFCPGFLEPLSKRNVRDGFTSECEARLDEYFLDKIPPLMPFSASDHRISWRYVFDQPLVKRRLVLESLEDTECQSSNKNSSSVDLAERCNVSAIADFATFKYQCAGGYFDQRARIRNGMPDPRGYTHKRKRSDEDDSEIEVYIDTGWAYYRYAWIAAKCDAVPPEALASLDIFESSLTFDGRPKGGEEGWWWVEQGFEAYRLMGIADNLSNELSRTTYGYEQESISNWQSVNPVIAELIRLKELLLRRNRYSDMAPYLKHAIAAQIWKKKRPTNMDPVWLLDQIGKADYEDWQRATEEVLTMMKQQGVESRWR